MSSATSRSARSWPWAARSRPGRRATASACRGCRPGAAAASGACAASPCSARTRSARGSRPRAATPSTCSPRPRDRVAVVGVGGLGHLAVQYAKAAGFDVIAMTHSKDKEALLRQLGADEVVHDGRGLAEAGGADVILATSNSYAPVTDAIQGLRPEGRLVLMGVAHEPLSVPTSIMWVRGSVLGSVQNSPEHLYEALDYVARGKVKVMAETYPLSDVARAYDRVKAGSVRFRAVIVP